jgi:hypothetical protein
MNHKNKTVDQAAADDLLTIAADPAYKNTLPKYKKGPLYRGVSVSGNWFEKNFGVTYEKLLDGKPPEEKDDVVHAFERERVIKPRDIVTSWSKLMLPAIDFALGGGLSGSNISDTGTQITIAAGASSGLSVAAGGVNVSGNSTFNNNVTITGDLSVAGTASFTNTDNLNIKDKFILINSGSTTLADSGWVTQYNAAGSGSAFFLEAASTGQYGRFAVAYDVIGTSTSLAADEYVVTAKLSAASAPSNTVSSSWGSTNSGGNMWIKQDTGDIYIWA